MKLHYVLHVAGTCHRYKAVSSKISQTTYVNQLFPSPVLESYGVI